MKILYNLQDLSKKWLKWITVEGQLSVYYFERRLSNVYKMNPWSLKRLHLTNIFHGAMCLFSDTSQMTSKFGKK